ncbi:MAG: TIGR00269 family protein [Candidatus Aenigmatarchaeota archaeon]
MKCECGRKAIIHRHYEGSALCPRHFILSFEKRIKKTIRRYNMLKSGDRIAVAISGGADSLSLLNVMHKIVSPRHDMNMFAVCIDEGIKGYRDVTIKRAKRFCKRLGIELHIASFADTFGRTMDQKVSEVGKENACMYCSIGRRWLLNRTARELGATRIATGHNLNDEAETILMNWIRGDIARAARYGAITDLTLTKTKTKLLIPKIKPLRETPENECTLYAKLKKMGTTRRVCPYKSGIRRDVWIFLRKFEKKHPGTNFSILHTFDKILPLLREYSESIEGPVMTCDKCGEISAQPVCRRCQLWP